VRRPICLGGLLCLCLWGRLRQRTSGVAGFYGASSMERLPTETAITAQIRRFVDLSLPAPAR